MIRTKEWKLQSMESKTLNRLKKSMYILSATKKRRVFCLLAISITILAGGVISYITLIKQNGKT